METYEIFIVLNGEEFLVTNESSTNINENDAQEALSLFTKCDKIHYVQTNKGILGIDYKYVQNIYFLARKK